MFMKSRKRGLAAVLLATALIGQGFCPAATVWAADATMDDHMVMPAPAKPAAQDVALVPNRIVIDNFAFAPVTLTVKAGTSVTWVNNDDEPHTVVHPGATDGFKSPPLDTGDKFSFVFRTPGTYSYFCSIHPFMQGTVIVE